MTYTRTTGARTLAAIAKKSGGHPSVAARIGCASSASRHWCSGRRTPSPTWREKLREAYGIPVPAWDEPAPVAPAPVPASPAAPSPPAWTGRPSKPSPPVARSSSSKTPKGAKVETAPAVAPPPLPDVPDEASTEALISWVIANLKKLQTEGDSDPFMLASFRDRAVLLGTLTTAINTRARLRGEDRITIERFMKSPWWSQIQGAISRSLRNHPEAAAALARELEALEEASERAAKGGQHGEA